MNNASHPWRDAFKLTIPVMLGYLPLGAAYGVLAAQTGLPWWLVLVISLTVYSGAGQFLLVGLLAAGAGFFEIAVAIFLINSRHLFYGLSLLEQFAGSGWRKPYLIFALTDETYSLLTTNRQLDNKGAFRVSLLNHGWWMTGSLIGGVAGSAFAFNGAGLEFSLVALFLVLTMEQYKNLRELWPFACALAIGIATVLLLPEKHFLLVSIGASCLLLLAHFTKQQQRARGV